MTLQNDTIAFNTGASGAGGIQISPSAGATTSITNCTITGNTAYTTEFTAGFGGGGIQNSNVSTASTITLDGTILAGNSAFNGRSDASFGAAVTVNSTYSLIGVADTFTYSDAAAVGSNKTGTQASPLSPNLGGFVRSGGSSLVGDIDTGGTQVMRPNPGSLAIDNGDPAAPLATDQRGLPRAANTVDIGAVEIQSTATEPANTFTNLANVTTAGDTTYNFDVTYETDGGTIDVTTLGNSNLALTYPTGTTVNPTFVNSTPGTNASSVVAHYSVSAPDGAGQPALANTEPIH